MLACLKGGGIDTPMPDDLQSSGIFAPSMQANPVTSPKRKPMAGVRVAECYCSTLQESLTLMGSTTCPPEGGGRADGRHCRKHFKADRATEGKQELKDDEDESE